MGERFAAAANASGCWPARPHAERSLNELMSGDVLEERLFADDPASTHLRVGNEVIVGAERAVVVASHRGSEEHAVLPGDLLLEERADRLVLDEGFRRRS